MIKSLVINNTRRMISYIATVLFLERDWSRKKYRCRSPQVSAETSPYFQVQHGSWTPLIFWLMQFIIFILRQRVANRNAWLNAFACVNANISNYSSLLLCVLLWDTDLISCGLIVQSRHYTARTVNYFGIPPRSLEQLRIQYVVLGKPTRSRTLFNFSE